MAPLSLLVTLALLASMLSVACEHMPEGEASAPSIVPIVPSRLRVNAQEPGWYGACPPPAATEEACVNGGEALGLPTTGLRLTWELTLPAAAPRGLEQTQYEAEIVARASGSRVWSSGVVAGAATAVIASPVPELAPEESYAWRVRSLVGLGHSPAPGPSNGEAGGGNWSDYAFFDTAPSQESWSVRGSEWIGGFNEMRGSLVLPDGAAVERARLYAIGLGAFVVSLNGVRVGDHVMDPPQTAYPSRTLFASFNVTTRLRPGENVIGALIGRYKYGYMDVWCNMTAAGQAQAACRSFRLQLVVELAGGTTLTFVTSSAAAEGGWVGRQGPVLYDHEYHGEIRDARRSLVGWDDAPLSGFPQGTWQPVLATPPVRVPDGALFPAQIPPVRTVETRRAVSITKIDQLPGEAAMYCNSSTNRIGGSMKEDQFGTSMMNLTCRPGSGTIDKIIFANFGQPTLADDCSAAALGPCLGSNNSRSVVERLCLGRASCLIAPRTSQFGGGDPCPQELKTLVVLASGCTPAAPPPPPKLPANETSWVYDFGQNVAGFTSLHVAGPAGSKVYVRHAEDLWAVPAPGEPSGVRNHLCSNMKVQPGSSADGGCTNCNNFVGAGQQSAVAAIWGGNCANQTNLFVLNGSGATEHFVPEFTYAGFRYAQVWGLPASLVPTADSLVQHFVHTDVPPTGGVWLPAVTATPGGTEDVLNRVQHAVVYAQRSNLWSIPTDCPQRERRGWLGDAQMSSDEAMLNHDMEAFYANFLDVIRDDQLLGCEVPMGEGGGSCSDAALKEGSLPDVVPFTTGPYGGFPGSVVWQAAYPVIAWHWYRAYNDTAGLRKHWPGLVALADYWGRQPCSATGLNLCGGLGDWVDTNWPNHTTPDTECSAFYNALAMAYMSRAATAIALPAEALLYAARYDAMSALLRQQFANSSLSQTSLVMQLALSLAAPPLANSSGPVAPGDVAAVAARLVDSIRAVGNHTTSGIIGATFVFDVLAATGHGGVALDMLERDDFPSFGYMVSQGATTLWENWQGSLPWGSSSDNHIMFGGGVGTFTYRHLAGLRQGAGSVAWRHIDVRPIPDAVSRLRSANASLLTPRGETAVSWALSDDGSAFTMNVTVPLGSTASVAVAAIPSLPTRLAESAGVLFQGGHCVPAPASSGVLGCLTESTPYAAVVVTVGSGRYRFDAAYARA